jgi:hypothetical protein
MSDTRRQHLDAVEAVVKSFHYEPYDMAEKIVKLHAAIDRVRALHDYPFRGDRVCIVCRTGDATPMPYPCPTLRALDGDA